MLLFVTKLHSMDLVQMSIHSNKMMPHDLYIVQWQSGRMTVTRQHER